MENLNKLRILLISWGKPILLRTSPLDPLFAALYWFWDAIFFSFVSDDNAKECSNYHTIALISHASKVMPKFSKPGFSNRWTMNFQMFKLVLEKAKEPEIKLPTSAGSWKKQRVPEKHLFLVYWLCQSLWLCGSQ